MSSNEKCLLTAYRCVHDGWHRLIFHCWMFRNIHSGTFLRDREPDIVYCSPLFPASSALWYYFAIGRLYNAFLFFLLYRPHAQLLLSLTGRKCDGYPRNLIYSGSGLGLILNTWLLDAWPRRSYIHAISDQFPHFPKQSFCVRHLPGPIFRPPCSGRLISSKHSHDRGRLAQIASSEVFLALDWKSGSYYTWLGRACLTHPFIEVYGG